MEFDLLAVLRDPDRLRALAETELMDSPAEERFDQYTELAATILNAPAALVSLVDDHRQFFKSAYGLGEPWATLRETPLSHSFCKHAVASGEPLIVNDAPNHPLVRDNRAIPELGVLAYAGVPLEDRGQTLGVFCVVDTQPRTWTAQELATIRALAAAVTSEIALLRSKREVKEREALLSALTDSALDVIVTMNGDGEIVFCNRATELVFGQPQHSYLGSPVTALMPERYRAAHRAGLARVEAGGEPRVLGRVLELHGLRANGEEFPVELSISRWAGRSGHFYTAVLRDVTERQRAAQALRETEEELRMVVEQAPIGMAVAALDGRWLRVNDAMCTIVGYTRDELLQSDFQTITHPDDLDADLALVDGLIRGETTHYQLEKRYLHRLGHNVWVLLAVSLVRDQHGAPAFFIAQVQDITARRLAEAQANTFFEHSVDMLAITNAGTTFERVNPAFERVLGWSASELVGKLVFDFVHPDDQDATVHEAGVLNENGSTQRFRHRFRAKNGNYHWLEWNAHSTQEGKFFAVARDMSKQMEMEDQLRQTSLVDELTGLQNRRGFMALGEQQLSNASRYGRPMVVLFADLNGMKQINDQLGHDVGDRALVAMAEVLRNTFRRADILARLGGDEFVVLAEGDREFSKLVAARVQKNVEAFNARFTHPFELSVSLGVTAYDPDETKNLGQLLQSADKLMYDAKRRMRGSAPQR
ncbi:MAG TPA: PAS domain S-box protein [Polyangiales bacterium]|nr:PAS domain S-box protein [Polyangiales bacterium]